MKRTQEAEAVKVRNVLEDWFEAMTEKDLDGIYKAISPDYIQHLPNVEPIVGVEGFKGVMEQYLPIFGPTTHIESKITVSGSGDLAYAIGSHDHVMLDKPDEYTIIDKHIIVFKKIDGTWLIDGISEM